MSLVFQGASALALDAKGRIIADTLIDAYTHEIKTYSFLQYDGNENVVQWDVYERDSTNTLVHSTTNMATYDQNPNPLYHYKYASGNSLLAPSYLYFGKNNLVKVVQTRHWSGQTGVPWNYSYEYNEKGLPVKRWNSNHNYAMVYEYQP